MLKLNKDIEYALACLVRMAEMKGPRSARELSEALHLPASLVAKMLQQLTRAGIIQAVHGARGGYLMDRGADSISVMDIIQALHGTASPVQCIDNKDSCPRFGQCRIRAGMHHIALVWERSLKGMTIRDFCTAGSDIPA